MLLKYQGNCHYVPFISPCFTISRPLSYPLADMNTKYEQIKNIHKTAIESHDANELRKIPSLLNEWKFKCREDDGELLWTNLSMPESIGETIIVGLRYRKRDTTFTEDIFEISAKNPNEVKAYYTGKYQKHCPEYKHTHKLQDVEARSFISVNSCSLYIGEKNDS